jgi:hypothetical protein
VESRPKFSVAPTTHECRRSGVVKLRTLATKTQLFQWLSLVAEAGGHCWHKLPSSLVSLVIYELKDTHKLSVGVKNALHAS